MPSTESGHSTVLPARLTRAHVAIFSVATVLSAAVAVVLALGFDVSWHKAVFLPLLVSGLLLITWNTHWALCFAAFAIAPFGVVQLELLGITVNLPEVLILILASKEGYSFLAQRERPSQIFPQRTMALFLFAAAAAIVTGVLHQNGTLRVLQDCRQFTEFLVLFWLVIHRVAGRAEALRIVCCYVLGATLLAVHGIIQQVVPVGIVSTQILSDLDLYQGVRSTSFYGATMLGGIMVLTIASAVGVLLGSSRRSVKLLMAVCIFLCTVAIVFTQTRASWIGLLVAVALIALSIRPTPRLIAFAIGCAAMFGLLLGPLVIQRLHTLTDPQRDASITARVQYYASAARIGQAHPLFGLGWGPYYEIDTLLGFEPNVLPLLNESLATDGTITDLGEEATVHSAYLQLLVKTGLLGIGAFAAILTVWLAWIWTARYIRFQGDSAHGLYVGITAGLAGYLLHCTVENFFQWPVMAQSFWLLFGLSFLLTPRAEQRVPRYRVPLAFMACVAMAFLLFMAVCVRMERGHPNHYQQNVAMALEKGDLVDALEIARQATVARWNEPMPYTVYARLLLRNGDTDAALAELVKAVGSAEKPGALRQRNTGVYYYFAPARLAWGQYCATQGAQDQAIQQFELARAYADLRDPEYAEFHPVLYATYAARGRWGRALEFGRPDVDAIAKLSHEGLVHLSEAATARGEADLVDAVARLVATKGLTLPAANDFRAVALARAWSSADADTLERVTLLEQFRHAIADMDPIPLTESQEDSASMRPLAYAIDRTNLATDAALPVLLLWGRGPADLSGLSGFTFTEGAYGIIVTLEGTSLRLQLRQHENRVDWVSVEKARPEDTVLPGWIDSARDWFDLREGPSAPVYSAEGRGMQLERPAWYFSVPTRVADGKGYLIAGRVLDRDGGGRLSWQFINAGNQVVQSGNLSDGKPIVQWTPISAYLPPVAEGSHAVRVAVELLRPIGHAAFDDLLLVELEAPELIGEQPTP